MEEEVREIAKQRGFIIEYIGNGQVCWRYNEWNRKEFNTIEEFIVMWKN